MNKALSYVAAATFAMGVFALAPNPASAMPAANVAEQMTPDVEQAHAVRMCNRFGRCWWTYAGHFHGRYGYAARPVYWHGGYRYGWRHPYRWHRYGYGGWHRGWGWRGHRHWR